MWCRELFGALLVLGFVGSASAADYTITLDADREARLIAELPLENARRVADGLPELADVTALATMALERYVDVLIQRDAVDFRNRAIDAFRGASPSQRKDLNDHVETVRGNPGGGE